MLWDPYFKISCLNVAFSLVAGPQKIRTVIQKGANILLFNIFKVPAIFLKGKLCRACKANALGEICRFFGIDLLKI